MSREDWKQTEALQSAGGHGRQNPGPHIARDLVIEDGQTITLGDQTFTFFVTPGHTPGATSVEYRARDPWENQEFITSTDFTKEPDGSKWRPTPCETT